MNILELTEQENGTLNLVRNPSSSMDEKAQKYNVTFARAARDPGVDLIMRTIVIPPVLFTGN